MTSSLQSIKQGLELRDKLADAAEAERQLRIRLASSYSARYYQLDGRLTMAKVREFIETMAEWRRLDPEARKPIHIVLNVDGHFQSLALYSSIRMMRESGYHIIVEVAGMASGQIAILLRAASESVMTEHSWIDFDELPFGRGDNSFSAEIDVRWQQKVDEQMRSLLCAGTALTEETLARQTKRKSVRISAQKALQLGIIDRISEQRPAGLVEPIAVPQPADLPELEESATVDDRLAHAAIRKLHAEASVTEMDTAEQMATALNNGVVHFFSDVDDDSAATAKRDLGLALRRSDSDIELLIDSPGGSILAGNGLIDFCLQLESSGRTIDTMVYGYAASMGGVMLQVGKRRKAARESWILVHRASSWFGPTTTDAADQLRRLTKLQKQLFALLGRRSKFKTAKNVLKECMYADRWYSAEEALKVGLIDEIV